METLLLEKDEESLINQLKNLRDFLIYYNVIVEVKIGNQFLPYDYNTLYNDENNNILTDNHLLDYKKLNRIDIPFNEIVFNIDDEKSISSKLDKKELILINKKSDLDKFFKENNDGILYTNTKSRIKILYPNKSGKMIKLFEYNYKSAIETDNKICIFRRGSKIRATTLAKQNNFNLISNYYDNPTIYKIKKLH